jgi:hypothetical protein
MVGVNPHSEDWAAVYRKIHRYPIRYTGDYSRYDKTLPYEATMYVQHVIEKFYQQFDDYSTFDKEMRTKLFQLSWCNYRIAGNVLYWIGHGNPSGCALTTYINSLVNSFLIRYSFFELHPEAMLYEFDQNVSFCCYGDDNVFSITEKVKDTFSLKKIAENQAQYGVILKPGEGDSYRHLLSSDIVFLQRKFRIHQGWTYAPLSQTTIHNSLYYYRKKLDNLIQAAHSASIEMAHYSEKEWNDFRRVLENACRDAKLPLRPTMYQECRETAKNGKFDEIVQNLINK